MTFVTGLRGLSSKSLMSIRVLPLLALALTLGDVAVFAQFGSPFPGGQGGGYPGGGYPGQGQGGGIGGIPFPGRNRKNAANGPVENVVGNIQRISTTQVVLDPGDRRNIVVMLDRNTKYFGKTGDTAKFGDFDAGDEVSIDAARDNQSMLHAQRVTLNSKGSAGNITDNSDRNSDPDRPKLKRAGGSDSGSDRAPSRASASSDAPPSDDPDRPRLRRNPAPSAQSEDAPSSTPAPSRRVTAVRPVEGDPIDTTSRRADAPEVSLKPVARDADDPGAPVLRRGAGANPATRREATAPPQESASARPSIKSEEVNGVVRAAPAPVIEEPSSRQPDAGISSDARQLMQGQPTGDPIINAAREAAWQWADTLPNYIVKQYTTRYQTETSRGNRTSWQALDVVTADVVSENGHESYKNLQVNGKPTKDVEKSGSWSTGEFSTILLNLLAPGTDADFHGKRTSTIGSRQAWRYDYTVEQKNSNWNIIAASQTYKPAYSGAIWVDKQTNRVLRIEMASKQMPGAFPLDTVESAVEYDFVLVGDQKFLLPTHSEALSCTRGSSDCTRNVIDFRNYRKFGADTSITFETEKP